MAEKVGCMELDKALTGNLFKIENLFSSAFFRRDLAVRKFKDSCLFHSRKRWLKDYQVVK